MLGNLHVRFGVGAGVELPGLHHYKFLTHKTMCRKTYGDFDTIKQPAGAAGASKYGRITAFPKYG